MARQPVVHQEADAQRSEHLRVGQADRNRYRDHLQQSLGLREQADRLAANERIVNRLTRREQRSAVGDERPKLPRTPPAALVTSRRLADVSGSW
jgi:hypothetical protein